MLGPVFCLIVPYGFEGTDILRNVGQLL